MKGTETIRTIYSCLRKLTKLTCYLFRHSSWSYAMRRIRNCILNAILETSITITQGEMRSENEKQNPQAGQEGKSNIRKPLMWTRSPNNQNDFISDLFASNRVRGNFHKSGWKLSSGERWVCKRYLGLKSAPANQPACQLWYYRPWRPGACWGWHRNSSRACRKPGAFIQSHG